MLLAFMHTYLWQNQLVHAKLGSWLTMDEAVMVHDQHQPQYRTCRFIVFSMLFLCILRTCNQEALFPLVTQRKSTYLRTSASTVMLSANHKLAYPAAGHDPSQ